MGAFEDDTSRWSSTAFNPGVVQIGVTPDQVGAVLGFYISGKLSRDGEIDNYEIAELEGLLLGLEPIFIVVGLQGTGIAA